ncbi:glycosyltransferase family 2 protein, partial [Aeromonas veronii]|uniref:glycosyltransferase family 2 protein n=1 Tax=Aeromonas veronii TaxID=654 RepID=UPI002AF6B5A9
MITIMTPTYNRAYVLPRLYDSLCQQTRRDFEWLVIDDGSTDGTAELIFDYRVKAG